MKSPLKVLIMKKMSSSTDMGPMDEEMDENEEALNSAAEDVMNALEKSDVEAFKEALKSFIYLCTDSE